MTAEERAKHYFHNGVLVKFDDSNPNAKTLKRMFKEKPPYLVCAAKTTRRTETAKSGESYEVVEQMIQLDVDGALRWLQAENFVRY